MYNRIYDNLEEYLRPNKVLILYGARRVGKTTLVESFLKQSNYRYKLVSGDDITVQSILSSSSFDEILTFCEGYELIVIDEAQNIPNIGQGLKIIVDQMPGIRVIATGSSSFDLANKVGEPLVGRQRTLTLYPVSQFELKAHYNKQELKQHLPMWLRFGAYPEVLTLEQEVDKIEYLNDLVGAYLYKDILSFHAVKNAVTLHNLVKLLAFQIGSEVSLHELSKNIQVDVKTVARYLDLLEKTFVIRRLQGYSSNLRKEINKKHKYFFLDLGVRNAVIANFNGLDTRNDIGQLWENFLFIERMKRNAYVRHYAQAHFWRNYQGAEVDLLELLDGNIEAFEFKYKQHKPIKNHPFMKDYPDAGFSVIDQTNYLEFIT